MLYFYKVIYYLKKNNYFLGYERRQSVSNYFSWVVLYIFPKSPPHVRHTVQNAFHLDLDGIQGKDREIYRRFPRLNDEFRLNGNAWDIYKIKSTRELSFLQLYQPLLGTSHPLSHIQHCCGWCKKVPPVGLGWSSGVNPLLLWKLRQNLTRILGLKFWEGFPKWFSTKRAHTDSSDGYYRKKRPLRILTVDLPILYSTMVDSLNVMKCGTFQFQIHLLKILIQIREFN